MPQHLPAISLIAPPGRRAAIIAAAAEFDRRGYPAIVVPSPFAGMALCQSILAATRQIKVATGIQPIYARTAVDFAEHACYLHEVSGGRFIFGIGIAHAPSLVRLGVNTAGRPLADIRDFVSRLRAVEGQGSLPPIILAALRGKMVGLAAEIADGLIYANGCVSHAPVQLAQLPAARRADPDFFIGNMVPTCISDDIEAAKAVNRRTLTGYAMRPNYRNYWKECGYRDEMEAVEKAIAEGREGDVPKYLTDRWLADTTLFGTAAKVRDGVEAMRAAGIKTPTLVPSSAAGNQMKAIQEVLAAFS
jgi:alkanesulfonate monooxygenase SsuD/methylene tetrahydromethanopterin reductase-like flavin-dependent oxidoreductase (luciferase family)